MARAQVGALFASLGLDTAQFRQNAAAAQGIASRLGRGLKKAFIGIGIAGTAAFGAASIAVRRVADDADRMAKASQKFGVPIEELSRLRHAAQLSGVSFEGLGTGLKKLSQNLNDFAQGKGEAKDAFESLGISATNADGSLRSAQDVLLEIAARFKEMPDGAEKTALAMDLMGRSGADLIPLLNSGADGIQAMKDEADALGIVINENTAKASERFNDNLDRLGKVATGIGIALAERVIPHLADFTDWLVESGPRIVEMAGQFFDLSAAAVSFGVEFGGPVFNAIGLVGGAVFDLGKGIGELILMFVNLGTQAVESVRALYEGVNTWLTDKLTGIFDGVTSKVKAVGDGFRDLWQRVVGGSYVPDMIDGIAEEFARLNAVMVVPAMAATDAAAASFERMQARASAAARSVGEIEPEADRAGNAVDRLGQAGDQIFDRLIDGTLTWRDALSTVADAIKDIIGQQIRNASGGGLGSVLGKLIGGIGGSFFGGGGFTGFNTPSSFVGTGGLYADGGVFNRGRVLAFANGGVVNSPTLFPMANGMGLMGEAGPEAILPLARGADGKLGVRAQGGGGVVLNFNSNVDARGSRLTEQQYRSIAQQEAQRAVGALVSARRDDPSVLA